MLAFIRLNTVVLISYHTKDREREKDRKQICNSNIYESQRCFIRLKVFKNQSRKF